MILPLLKKARVSGKRVFLRADVDVPFSQQTTSNKQQTTIEDETRLLAWVPTIEYLLKHEAKVIVAGHLGRPKLNHESRIMNQEFSLLPVAQWLNCHPEFISGSKMLKQVQHDTTKTKLGEFDGWEITPKLFLLENLRFYKGEEGNDEEFAKKLANIADIYVNDAFAVSHRAHASIVGVPKYLPHFAGFRLQKEIDVLSKVLKNPDRPLAVIVGGAKIETKLSLVEKMHHFADYVLVGGKIAQETKELLKVQHEKLHDRKSVLLVGELNDNGTDITQKSVENFLQIVNAAKTIVWNGPVGLISNIPAKQDLVSRSQILLRKTSRDKYQISNMDSEYGTMKLAEGIVRSKAYSVVGGGDTLGFLKSVNLLGKFSFVSTGGGAMLEYLSTGKLVGIESLK